jgi:hypothetical protein
MHRPGALAALLLSACSTSAGAADDGGTEDGAPADAGSDVASFDGEPCATGYLGDPAAAPELDLQILRADESVSALNDGDTVPMILPPQGGRVIFVGVHATNVDGCSLQLTGALRDLSTQAVRVDSRTVDLVATGDGYGVSGAPMTTVSAAIANFSNVPLCPNEWSPTDLYGNVYGLEVTIQDRRGKQLTKKIHVIPQCGEPQNLDQCLCICKGGYVLGMPCGDM